MDEPAVYAMYLGTLLTVRAAIRDGNHLAVCAVLADAHHRHGPEEIATLTAVADASSDVRRTRDDVVRTVRERMRDRAVAPAAA